MKMLGMLRVTLVLFTAALLASKAQAIPLASDVSFDIPPEYTPDDVADVSANDNLTNIGDAFGNEVLNPWVLLDKTDDPIAGDNFEGVRFTLSAMQVYDDPLNLADEYTWGLSWINEPLTSNGLPLFTDFVFVTKGAQTAYAYYFDEVYFPSDDLSGDGEFLITYKTPNGKNIPDLSHASVYARTTEEFELPGGEAPVPGTLFLLGLGLVGLAGSRRRNS